ncbi:MAG: hypothetical protein L3J23_04835 [Flavobacteriaceae bacterium]|nr:hypothetical protein [Flavobacteriaceae bacterium]
MTKSILKYQYLSFIRVRMTTFKTSPDFIVLILSLALLTMMAYGVSSENFIEIETDKLINYNFLIVFNFFIIFFFEGYIYKYNTPNYRYIKLLLPYKRNVILMIDLIYELFSYKGILILLNICYLFIFCYVYELSILHTFNLVGFLLLFITFVNSILLVRIIKEKMKGNAFDFHKNFYKIFFTLILILAVINSNLDIINLNSVKAIFRILGFSIFCTVILIITFFRINSIDDKI